MYEEMMEMNFVVPDEVVETVNPHDAMLMHTEPEEYNPWLVEPGVVYKITSKDTGIAEEVMFEWAEETQVQEVLQPSFHAGPVYFMSIAVLLAVLITGMRIRSKK